ncbi:MAG: hypothetical protein KDJ46_10325 [Rhodobiaceae bacterium]|nr:hypothetical protein [Rhodobiaceae bacterium]
MTNGWARAAGFCAAAGLALAIGACGRVPEFSGADITRVAAGGIGALTGTRPKEDQNRDIEVRARSPLVIPPDNRLPPPENPEQEQARLGADWPVDPDLKAREVAALEKARRDEAIIREKLTVEGRSRALTPDEMKEGTRAPAPTRPLDPYLAAGGDASRVIPPDELRELHKRRMEAQKLAESQGQPQLPTRSGSLIEPPQPGRVTTSQVVSADGQVHRQSEEITDVPAPATKKKGWWDRMLWD